MFASDVPFEPKPGLYIRETIRCIEGLDISAADKQKIYEGNARRLTEAQLRRSHEADLSASPSFCSPRPSWAATCESLASLALPNTTITIAQPVAAGEFMPPGRHGGDLRPRSPIRICPHSAAWQLR